MLFGFVLPMIEDYIKQSDSILKMLVSIIGVPGTSILFIFAGAFTIFKRTKRTDA